MLLHIALYYCCYFIPFESARLGLFEQVFEAILWPLLELDLATVAVQPMHGRRGSAYGLVALRHAPLHTV